MSRNYDNWERLVAAVLRKEQLRQLFHEDSRSPSLRSEASSSSSSNFRDLDSPHHDLPSFSDFLGASAKLLGHGTFGSTYSAAMDNGMTVMWDWKCNFTLLFSTVNLMCLATYSVGESFVHKSDLGWEERLGVAVGAAKGIAYIHRQDGAKFVHGNIKASNIFLNTKQYGCVTDVGLSMLTSQMTVRDYLAAEYRAPEVTHTKTVTQALDVYSFGVVLIELVSGKTSQITTDDGEVVSLVTWIHSTIREEWTNEVLDIKLLNYEKEEAMVRLLQLAMRCVVIYPEDRPKMSEVVSILEEISGINTRLEHLLPMLTLHNE
ncbi:hypothetical protein RD792_005426 [Penstemon davidsonii]|uniref:Protein kinase domain-containing protein n=1 Tax=Penstemon davidsonii TaxID=160366 RepID=A0ABR0DKK6_9LAMI|nr:hypothetical protein RD792_005426 [Penstemon davidsonii]